MSKEEADQIDDIPQMKVFFEKDESFGDIWKHLGYKPDD